ncbi:MAG: hypothetical protein ABI835_19915, partial [Chloroflexota bacterium]
MTMLERSVLCKHLVMFYLLITVLFLLFSGCTQAPTVQIALTPSKIIVTTPRQQVVPTATVEFCGVGLVDHYVRMWVQGQGAQIVCDSLVVAIRREGEQPTIWDGQLLENATSYEPVCSDRSSLLGYEVIDTGGHTYGTSWCQWMVSTYGASGSITDPDLFNIVSPAQQAENAQMETQIAAPYAPIESQQTAYAIACIEHNGYIATNGFGSCRVDYPG